MKSVIIKRPPFAQLNGNSEIKDSMIPDEIRDLLVLNGSGHITVAEEDGYLWVASKRKAKPIRLSDYKEFEICYMKPAKSGGFVAIQAWSQERGKGCTSIIEFGAYSDQALASAIESAHELEPVLGYRPQVNYWGPDC